MSKPRPTKIRERTVDGVGSVGESMTLSGSLNGRDSYLILDASGRWTGALVGRSLYRLTKAYVRHWEADDGKV